MQYIGIQTFWNISILCATFEKSRFVRYLLKFSIFVEIFDILIHKPYNNIGHTTGYILRFWVVL